MSEEEIRRYFAVVAEMWKDGASTIGRFNIGRISWLSLGEEAEIYTATSKGTWHYIRWRAGEPYLHLATTVRPPEALSSHGTVWKIRTRYPVDAFQVRAYLKEWVYLPVLYPSFRILVNNHLVRPTLPSGRLYVEETLDDPKLGQVRVWIALDGRWPSLRILVKGIRNYQEMWFCEALVNVSTSIELLGREKLPPAIVQRCHWLATEALLRWLQRAARSYLRDLWEVRHRLARLALFERKELGLYLPLRAINDERLYLVSDLLDRERVCFIEHADQAYTDHRVQAAIEHGYLVVVAEYPLNRVLQHFQIPSLSDLPDSILQPPGRETEESAPLLTVARHLYHQILDLWKQTRRTTLPSTPPLRTHAGSYTPQEPSHPPRPRSSFQHFLDLRQVSIVLGEHHDPSIRAWTTENRIVLNRRNPLIQTLLSHPHSDPIYLADTIIHEFVHLLGYRNHSEAFIRTYNALMEQYLLSHLRRTSG